MKIKHLFISAFFAVALAFIACGDESSNDASNTSEPVFSFESPDDLPRCTTKKEGDSVFVELDSSTRVCKNKKWEIIKIEEIDSSKTDDDFNYKIYIKLDDSPKCNMENENDTIYIAKESLFYTCQNKKWKKVKIIDEPSSSNNDSNSNGEPNYKIYKTLNDLPTCNNNSVGDTVYVIKKDLMYTCENKQWNVIEFEEESSSSEKRKQSDDDDNDDENESSSSKNKDKSSSSEKEQDLSSSSVSSSSITSSSSSVSSSSVTTTSSSVSSSSITSSSSSVSSSSITSSSSSMSSSSITSSSSSVSSSSITISSSSVSSSSITTTSSSVSSSSITTSSSSISSSSSVSSSSITSSSSSMSSSSITTSSSSMSSSSVSSSSAISYGTLIDTRTNPSTTYKTVKIGTQTWMAENLNYRVFYNKPTTPKDSGSYCYGDKGTSGNRGTANCETYGRLYTWAAAMDSVNQGGCGYGKKCTPNTPYHQGVCPSGWHLPDTTEWNLLRTNVANAMGISEGQVGKYLKTQYGWSNRSGGSSGNGNNALGFSALPAGYYGSSGFYDVGNGATFWSATEYNSIYAYYVNMYYSLDDLYSNYNNKNFAYSVRCLKN